MSIASRIEEMETHIGDVYDTIDYSYDTTGVNKNIINIPKYLKKGYIDIINNGTDTLYSNFPKVSGIGSNLSLTPTYEAPMKLNEIQGDTFQQTYTGKNKFNLTRNNTTYNNVTTQYKGSEFVLNGTTSSSANILSPDSNTLFSIGTFEAGTYAFTLITNSGYNANGHNSAFYLRKSDFNTVKSHGVYANDNFTSTFTLEEDSELFVQIYSNSGNVVFDDYHMYFQIELGSATDYEPYVGGTTSPNLDYPQEVETTTGLQEIKLQNKNLFDGIFQQGGLDLGGSGVETGVARIRTDFIPVEPNTTYTISNNSEELMQVGIGFYKNDKSYDTAHKINYGSWNNFPKTFTTQNDTTYIRCAFKAGDEAITPSGNYAIQLELGPTATTRIEHQEQNFELNLGKNLYDVSTCTNAYINSTGVVTSANTNLLTDYIKIDNTKKYTISLNTEFYFIGCAYYDKNKTYLSRDTINNSSSLTITIPNNTEYIRVWMCYATNTNISKTSVMQYEPMIEKGTQRTLYSEYFTPIELCKIGDYQDSIKRSTGKNLFDKDTIITDKYIDGSGNFVNDSNNFIGALTRIDNIKTYYVNASTGSAKRIAYYDSTQTFISRQLISTYGGTLTIPNNAEYLRLSCYNVDLDTLQLEQNSQATTYEPYLPIDTWYIHKEIGKYQITGYEGYSKNGNNYAIDPSTARNDFLKNSDGGNCLCTHFFSKLEAKNNYCWIGNGSFFVVCKTDVSDVSEFRNLMREITPTLYYILATPTDTLITNTELINQLDNLASAMSYDDTTNISSSSENLPMIISASALKNE